MVLEDFVAPADGEVIVSAQHGVEGGDLLFALNNQDAWHGELARG
jgi:hypothetical protein